MYGRGREKGTEKRHKGIFLSDRTFYIDCGCGYMNTLVIIHEGFPFKWVNHVLWKAQHYEEKRRKKRDWERDTGVFRVCWGWCEKREEEKYEENISKIKCPAVAMRDGVGGVKINF